MCGECFLLFPTTEDFDVHHCQVATVDKVEEVEDVAAMDVEDHKPSTSAIDLPQATECVHIGEVLVCFSFLSEKDLIKYFWYLT